MSKGRNGEPPKKYHKKIDYWKFWNYKFPWTTGYIPLHHYKGVYHVGSGHDGRRWKKWHFRHRKYFKQWTGRMSMRRPMAIEIWYWD